MNVQHYEILPRAVFLFAFLVVFLYIFKTIIVKRLRKIADNTKNDFDDVLVHIVQEINWIFYIVVSLYFSLRLFHFAGTAQRVINIVLLVVIVYQVIKSFQALIKYFTEKYIINYKKTHKKEDVAGIVMLSKIIMASLWFIGLLLIISNLGYNITSILAGLGIGGIAVALAIQNILDDMFSSFSLYFDKPFKTDDYIVVGNESGYVKKIGIKTTRLTTPQGEELIIPNKDLTTSRIQNFKRMRRRRVIFKIEVDQENTSMPKIKNIPDIIRIVVDEAPHADLERVHLKNIQGNRIIYEIAFSLRTNDYTLYLDTQQYINFGIIEKFKKSKISLADPIAFVESK
jgi:small-conductance mechanosensitive channel